MKALQPSEPREAEQEAPEHSEASEPRLGVVEFSLCFSVVIESSFLSFRGFEAVQKHGRASILSVLGAPKHPRAVILSVRGAPKHARAVIVSVLGAPMRARAVTSSAQWPRSMLEQRY